MDFKRKLTIFKIKELFIQLTFVEDYQNVIKINKC